MTVFFIPLSHFGRFLDHISEGLQNWNDEVRTEDGYIIHKCLNGDSGAFGLLVDKYRSGVYALAYSRLRNFHDAEDVAQEVFIRAYENLHKLRRWDSFASWLYRITSSLCMRWIRERAKYPDSEFIEDKDPGILEDRSIDSYREEHIFQRLHEALDSLPETHRQVLTLRYLGGMTSFDIARFVGVSPSAVRKRLAVARSALKAEMLDAIGAAFNERKLSASFTLRISEIVKHIRVRPLPRLGELPWSASIGIGILAFFLSLGLFHSLHDSVSYLIYPAAMETTRSKGTGEIPVDIVGRIYEREGDASMLSNRKISIVSVLTAAIGILSGSTLAQTEWDRYADNPVFRTGSSGAWDSTAISNPNIMFRDGEYKMWYTGMKYVDYNLHRIGYASSEDGIAWEKYDADDDISDPVLELGSSGSWDDYIVANPHVIYNNIDGIYEMWYSGHDGSNSRTGHAVSEDGIEWENRQLVDGTPDTEEHDGLLGASGEWDDYSVGPGPVFYDGSIYRMWYGGSGSSSEAARVGFATSEDGIHWTKYGLIDDTKNPVYPDGLLGPSGSWDGHALAGIEVLPVGDEYEMFYAGVEGYHGRTRIGYATSENGVDWEKYDNDPDTPTTSNHVFDIGLPETWDSYRVQGPSILRNGEQYKMWYVGNDDYHSTQAMGYAICYLPIVTAAIDIKPGSYPNSVNLGSNGVVPVAILSSPEFDATQVDANTVELAGAGVAIRGKGSKLMAHEEDVNGDGLLDLVIQVETENLDPGQFQDGYAYLTGKTYRGQAIEGADEIVIVPPDAAPAKPMSFHLGQNYPNSFNPDTWIPYGLSEDADVTIKIHSASGQLVRTLNLGHKPAGTYSTRSEAAHWDGTNENREPVASGLYFYTIQAEEFTATRKMLMVK